MVNVEFIKLGKDRPETEMRLLQKIEFGKEIIPFEFFKEVKIAETNIEVLNVYQFDPNNRFTIINDLLYKIPAEHLIYNYIDKNRKVLYDAEWSYRDDNKEKIVYIFNDLDISERDLKLFNDCDNKRQLKLKKIELLNDFHIYLVFKEDIDIVKNLIKLQREEERLEKENKKAEELKDKQKQKELEEKIGLITKDTKLEDKDQVICNNYLIDKERGIKIEFKKPICEIFNKADLINTSGGLDTDNFIRLCYTDIINDLKQVFETGKYEELIEKKFTDFIGTIKKHLLNFKIYSYNKETKEEKFIKEVKISVDRGNTGKIHFLINDIQIPKQKIKFLLRFLRGRNRHYWIEDNIDLIKRYQELDINIENFKYYSGTQLELLQGKEISVYYKEKEIPLYFEIKNPDRKKDNWQVKFGNLVLDKSYTEVKQAYNHSGYRSEPIAGQISSICESLKCEKLEDEIIKQLNLVLEKIRQAEIKAKTLFLDFVDKNKTKIILKDNFYLIKGKLKTYKLGVEKNEAKVWTYPNNNYICINEKTKAGHYLCKYDKLLQFCSVMLNDNLMREEISTIH